jgi:hypothetical protein
MDFIATLFFVESLLYSFPYSLRYQVCDTYVDELIGQSDLLNVGALKHILALQKYYYKTSEL